jgi:hypothetical protein
VFELPLALSGKGGEFGDPFWVLALRDGRRGKGKPGRVTSPWEMAWSGVRSAMPWTCFSSSASCTDLDLSGLVGRMSAIAVGAMVALRALRRTFRQKQQYKSE